MVSLEMESALIRAEIQDIENLLSLGVDRGDSDFAERDLSGWTPDDFVPCESCVGEIPVDRIPDYVEYGGSAHDGDDDDDDDDGDSDGDDDEPTQPWPDGFPG